MTPDRLGAVARDLCVRASVKCGARRIARRSQRVTGREKRVREKAGHAAVRASVLHAAMPPPVSVACPPRRDDKKPLPARNGVYPFSLARSAKSALPPPPSNVSAAVLCRTDVVGTTAARATGRGLSTTPARATQPVGYAVYWQYTTALAGAGLRVRPASPNKTLAAIPATVADLIERRFLGCMADSSSCLRTER